MNETYQEMESRVEQMLRGGSTLEQVKMVRSTWHQANNANLLKKKDETLNPQDQGSQSESGSQGDSQGSILDTPATSIELATAGSYDLEGEKADYWVSAWRQGASIDQLSSYAEELRSLQPQFFLNGEAVSNEDAQMVSNISDAYSTQTKDFFEQNFRLDEYIRQIHSNPAIFDIAEIPAGAIPILTTTYESEMTRIRGLEGGAGAYRTRVIDEIIAEHGLFAAEGQTRLMQGVIGWKTDEWGNRQILEGEEKLSSQARIGVRHLENEAWRALDENRDYRPISELETGGVDMIGGIPIVDEVMEVLLDVFGLTVHGEEAGRDANGALTFLQRRVQEGVADVVLGLLDEDKKIDSKYLGELETHLFDDFDIALDLDKDLNFRSQDDDGGMQFLKGINKAGQTFFIDQMLFVLDMFEMEEGPATKGFRTILGDLNALPFGDAKTVLVERREYLKGLIEVPFAGASEKFDNGDWVGGSTQVLVQLGESVPMMVAVIGATLLTRKPKAGVATGRFFTRAGLNAGAVATYMGGVTAYGNARNEEWFNNMSAVEQFGYISSYGVAEGLPAMVGANIFTRARVAAMAYKESGKSFLGAWTRGALLNSPMGALEEGVTEAITGGWQYTAEIAARQAGGDRTAIWNEKDYWRQVKEGWYAGVVMGGVMAGAGSAFTGTAYATVLGISSIPSLHSKIVIKMLNKKLNETNSKTVKAKILEKIASVVKASEKNKTERIAFYERMAKEDNVDYSKLVNIQNKIAFLAMKYGKALDGKEKAKISKDMNALIKERSEIEGKYEEAYNLDAKTERKRILKETAEMDKNWGNYGELFQEGDAVTVTDENVNDIIEAIEKLTEDDVLTDEGFDLALTAAQVLSGSNQTQASAQEVIEGLKNVMNVVRAFNKLGGMAELTMHRTKESFAKATGGEVSRGMWIRKRGNKREIHIYAPMVLKHTGYHEGFHDMLFEAFGQEAYDAAREKGLSIKEANAAKLLARQQIMRNLALELAKGVDSNSPLGRKLLGFLNLYKKQRDAKEKEFKPYETLEEAINDSVVVAEEFLVEVLSMLSSQDVSIEFKKGLLDRFSAFLSPLLEGLGVLNPAKITQGAKLEDLVSAISNITGQLREGEVSSMQEFEDSARALSPNADATAVMLAEGGLRVPEEKKGPKAQAIIYTAAFVNDPKSLEKKYYSTLPNKHGGHMTVSFKPDALDVTVGEKTSLEVIGRLTTDKVDVLILMNEKSTNAFPHITLATAEGVSPSAANQEIKNNQDKIGLYITERFVEATYGYFNSKSYITSEESKAQVIGQNAELSAQVREDLQYAKIEHEAYMMQKGGVLDAPTENMMNPAAIKEITGWELGADGKWKYEIQDGRLKEVKNGTYKLGDIYNAPEFYDAYPEAKDISVAIEVRPQGRENSWFMPEDNSIEINVKDRHRVLQDLVHELQHFVQFKEGFAIGGNADTFYQNPEIVEKLEKEAGKEGLIIKNEMLRALSFTIEEAIDEHEGVALDKIMTKEFLEKNMGFYLDTFDNLIERGLIDETADFAQALEDFYVELPEMDRRKLKIAQREGGMDEALDAAGEISVPVKEALHKLGNHAMYERLMGEVEARNISARLFYTAEQRARKTLESTEDVAREEQIAFFDSDIKTQAIDVSSGDAFIENEIKTALEGKGSFAHMTAENPGNATLSLEENAKRNAEMKGALDAIGVTYMEIDGYYNREEKSFFVKDISVSEAMKLGTQFEQESVSHSKGMLYTKGKHEGTMEPTTGEVDTNPDMKNHYSTIQTEDGPKKYSVGYDWGNYVAIPSDTESESGANIEFDGKAQMWGEFKAVHAIDEGQFNQLIKDGKIILNANIEDFSGKDTIFTSPDNMMVGQLVHNGKIIFEGGGGLYFPANTGKVWAVGSAAIGTRFKNEINKSIEENGVAHIAFGAGSLEKLSSNSAAGIGVVNIFKRLVDSKLISKSDFRQALREAAKSSNVDIDYRGSSEAVADKIFRNFLNPNNSFFPDRKLFVHNFINTLMKREGVKQGAERIFDALGLEKPNRVSSYAKVVREQVFTMLTEKTLQDSKVGEIYAILEVRSPVKTVRAATHKAYPFVVESINGDMPIIHVLKVRPHYSEVARTREGEVAGDFKNIKTFGGKIGFGSLPLGKGGFQTIEAKVKSLSDAVENNDIIEEAKAQGDLITLVADMLDREELTPKIKVDNRRKNKYIITSETEGYTLFVKNKEEILKILLGTGLSKDVATDIYNRAKSFKKGRIAGKKAATSRAKRTIGRAMRKLSTEGKKLRKELMALKEKSETIDEFISQAMELINERMGKGGKSTFTRAQIVSLFKILKSINRASPKRIQADKEGVVQQMIDRLSLIFDAQDAKKALAEHLALIKEAGVLQKKLAKKVKPRKKGKALKSVASYLRAVELLTGVNVTLLPVDQVQAFVDTLNKALESTSKVRTKKIKGEVVLMQPNRVAAEVLEELARTFQIQAEMGRDAILVERARKAVKKARKEGKETTFEREYDKLVNKFEEGRLTVSRDIIGKFIEKWNAENINDQLDAANPADLHRVIEMMSEQKELLAKETAETIINESIIPRVAANLSKLVTDVDISEILGFSMEGDFNAAKLKERLMGLDKWMLVNLEYRLDSYIMNDSIFGLGYLAAIVKGRMELVGRVDELVDRYGIKASNARVYLSFMDDVTHYLLNIFSIENKHHAKVRIATGYADMTAAFTKADAHHADVALAVSEEMDRITKALLDNFVL